MIAYQRDFTNKFPYLYFVEHAGYIFDTTNRAQWERLQAQIAEKQIEHFTGAQIAMLELTFTIHKAA